MSLLRLLVVQLGVWIPFGFAVWKIIAAINRWNYRDRHALLFDIIAISLIAVSHAVTHFVFHRLVRPQHIPGYFVALLLYAIFIGVCTAISFRRPHG